MHPTIGKNPESFPFVVPVVSPIPQMHWGYSWQYMAQWTRVGISLSKCWMCFFQSLGFSYVSKCCDTAVPWRQCNIGTDCGGLGSLLDCHRISMWLGTSCFPFPCISFSSYTFVLPFLGDQDGLLLCICNTLELWSQSLGNIIIWVHAHWIAKQQDFITTARYRQSKTPGWIDSAFAS